MILDDLKTAVEALGGKMEVTRTEMRRVYPANQRIHVAIKGVKR